MLPGDEALSNLLLLGQGMGKRKRFKRFDGSTKWALILVISAGVFFIICHSHTLLMTNMLVGLFKPSLSPTKPMNLLWYLSLVPNPTMEFPMEWRSLRRRFQAKFGGISPGPVLP